MLLIIRNIQKSNLSILTYTSCHIHTFFVSCLISFVQCSCTTRYCFCQGLQTLIDITISGNRHSCSYPSLASLQMYNLYVYGHLHKRIEPREIELYLKGGIFLASIYHAIVYSVMEYCDLCMEHISV